MIKKITINHFDGSAVLLHVLYDEDALTVYIYNRWETIYAFDRSRNVVNGIIENLLPTAIKEQMTVLKKYYRKKNIPIQDRDLLNVARRNSANIKNLVTRIFMSLRKFYGDNIGKFPSGVKRALK
jgi:hypothetical protein